MSLIAQPKNSVTTIDDAGAHIPYARKHLVGPAVDKPLSAAPPKLADLFPQPDWKTLVDQGIPVDCAAWLAMLYDSLGTVPRSHGMFKLSQAQWTSAYVDAIAWVRAYMGTVGSLAQAKGIAAVLAKRWNSNPKEITRLPVTQVAVYWAAGPGGKRTMRPLGSLSVRQAEMARWLPKLGWPENNRALRANLVPLKRVDGRWCVAQIKGSSYHIQGEPVASEEHALAACLKLMQDFDGATAFVGQRRGCEQRVGPDHRTGRDFSAQQLMDEFGVRGIQFGKSVPQKERQTWLNAAFDAFADLADVMCLPRKWIGLGGLGVAIGARGVSAAKAHYEPVLKVINVTRLRGSGSVAHEWFHALDHRLGRHHNATSLLSICRHLHLRTGHTEIMMCLAQALQSSTFFLQAKAIEALPRARKHYWVKQEELGARAFEAWVEDELAANGRHSPSLVHGTLDVDNAERPELSPYPRDTERRLFSGHFRRLAQELRKPSAESKKTQ